MRLGYQSGTLRILQLLWLAGVLANKLAIDWLFNYFIRGEKYWQLLFHADMQPVIELLDEYLSPSIRWWTLADRTQPWDPIFDMAPEHSSLRLHEWIWKATRHHHAVRSKLSTVKVASTPFKGFTEIQGLEHIAGIPVTSVPAHTEPIQSSLPDLLHCYKPLWLVLTGEGGEK
eukprot:2819351-Amphidinium_carterae.1